VADARIEAQVPILTQSMLPSTGALMRRPVLSALMSIYGWRAKFGWRPDRNHENLHIPPDSLSGSFGEIFGGKPAGVFL